MLWTLMSLLLPHLLLLPIPYSMLISILFSMLINLVWKDSNCSEIRLTDKIYFVKTVYKAGREVQVIELLLTSMRP
jgi:hypothetical protein